MVPFFVSFQPTVPMEENLPPYTDPAEPAVVCLLRKAAGVLLPQYVTQWRYSEITRHTRGWFPRLDARFAYYGKIRQIQLFRKIGVRHPESRTYSNRAQLYKDFLQNGSPWGYPLVLKGDTGGGGSFVFPLYQAADLSRCLERLPPDRPALIQRWVEHGGKDLRVVVYGSHTVTYFRVGGGQFYNNICRGGRLDHAGWPHLQEEGSSVVLNFCDRAGIDVAGFDLMFPDDGEPVFVEINHHFGRKGLGGTRGHRSHLLRAIQTWRQQCLENGGSNQRMTIRAVTRLSPEA
jgi:ribosomal protein S6--L-glutamate ligase